MSIFFCFCCSKLVNAVSFQNITENIYKMFFRKCYRESKVFIIACHCYITNIFKNFLSVESVKIFKHKSFGNFSCSVRSVVEENNRIVIVNSAFFTPDNSRKNEFIIVASCIRCFYTFTCGCSMFTLTKKKCVITFFNSIPAVISVHYIISADNCCNRRKIIFFKFIFNLLKESASTLRRSVTTVKKRVNINFFQTFISCKFNQSQNVIQRGVDTACGNQTENMQSRIILFSVVYSH